MRVLIVATNTPELPLRNGYDLRVHHMLRELASSHDLHALAPAGPDPHTEGPVQWVEHTGLPSRNPARLGPLVSRVRPVAAELAPLVRAAAEHLQPDVVHVVSDRLAPLGPLLDGLPTVLGALDAAHLNARAALHRAGGAAPRRLIQYVATRRLIHATYPRFDRVVVVSQDDADELRRLAPTIDPIAVPNGVNVDAFSPNPDTRRDPSLLLFTGALDYPPNIQAAECLVKDILPVVRAARPDVRVRLVGRDPADRISALEDFEGVEVMANVPDMAEHLSAAGTYVCPMVSGTGIKNKLLEAMANGIPCVSSPLALRGIAARDGQEVLVGSTPQQLGAAVLALLGDADLRSRVGSAGRAYVRAEHTWSSTARQIASIYAELVE